MLCDAPPRQCLAWHILPRLDGKLNASGDSISARCPAHNDRKPSFGISVRGRRFEWNCFKDCKPERIRAALIESGVPSGCLPRSAREREDLIDLLQRLAYTDTADHAVIRLHIAAALEGHYVGLPKGGELERVAGLARVSRTVAYEARKTALPSNHNPVITPVPESLSSRAGHSTAKSPVSGPSPVSGLSQVSDTPIKSPLTGLNREAS